MAQNSRSERIYLNLVTQINSLLQGGEYLDECFQLLKNYIFSNYDYQIASRKNNDVIALQNRYSRVKGDKLRSVVSYTDYDLILNGITTDLQGFVTTFKPEGITIDFSKYFINNQSFNWDFNDNFHAVLEFPNDFARIDVLFQSFINEMKVIRKLRVDKFFVEDGIRKKIDENRYLQLSEEDKKNVVLELMDWSDAIIIQKTCENGHYGEALVQIKQQKEEIEIWATGDYIAKSEVIFDIVDWFYNYQEYPKNMSEPFNFKLPFSSLLFLNSLQKNNEPF